LKPKDISLDHYVPWSFVVHDQLWNLIPTTKSVNSKKSDLLPSKKYLLQTKNLFSEKVWRDYVSCYVADLSIPNYETLLDPNALARLPTYHFAGAAISRNQRIRGWVGIFF
jgi:hypothetical protein